MSLVSGSGKSTSTAPSTPTSDDETVTNLAKRSRQKTQKIVDEYEQYEVTEYFNRPHPDR